jgi:hypothetical protein
LHARFKPTDWGRSDFLSRDPKQTKLFIYMQDSTHYAPVGKITRVKQRGFEPWFSRIVMGPPVLVLALISIRHIANPAHAVTGTTLNTPEAFTDTRVMGAWTLTLLVMQVSSMLSQKRLWLGHLQLVAFMGLTLAVRIFGFTHDGTTLAMGNQRIITIVEIVFLLLNSVGLALQTRRLKQP